MELVILMGLQAAGKSTFTRERFAATHAHINRDQFRNNRQPARRELNLLRESLEAGRSAVIDSTNPTRERREPLIAAGREFGCRVIGYYFQSEVQACKDRNALRTGKDRVPDVAIHTTVTLLERPAFAEGFDELYFVQLTDGGFVVTPWQAESSEHETG